MEFFENLQKIYMNKYFADLLLNCAKLLIMRIARYEKEVLALLDKKVFVTVEEISATCPGMPMPSVYSRVNKLLNPSTIFHASCLYDLGCITVQSLKNKCKSAHVPTTTLIFFNKSRLLLSFTLWIMPPLFLLMISDSL